MAKTRRGRNSFQSLVWRAFIPLSILLSLLWKQVSMQALVYKIEASIHETAHFYILVILMGIIFHGTSFWFITFAVQMLMPDTDLGYVVTHVSLNTDGSSLLLVGSHNLSVLYVHERVSEDGDTIICRYISAPLWILSCIDDIHFFLHFLTHYLSCKTKIATKSMGKHFPDIPLVVDLKIIFYLILL